MSAPKFKDARIEAMEKQLNWFNTFADYVASSNRNMYNDACEYADIKEEEDA